MTSNEITMKDGQRVRENQDGMRTKASRVVIGRHLGEQAVKLDEQFRQLGWCVKIAEDGANARKLANKAQVVVLPAGGSCESGFLTCAKLVAERSGVRVILVGPPGEDQERFALFAGAAGYVSIDTLAEVLRIALK